MNDVYEVTVTLPLTVVFPRLSAATVRVHAAWAGRVVQASVLRRALETGQK